VSLNDEPDRGADPAHRHAVGRAVDVVVGDRAGGGVQVTTIGAVGEGVAAIATKLAMRLSSPFGRRR
jgi:hypothetical protein